jgi:hypothetical protein
MLLLNQEMQIFFFFKSNTIKNSNFFEASISNNESIFENVV